MWFLISCFGSIYFNAFLKILYIDCSMKFIKYYSVMGVKSTWSINDDESSDAIFCFSSWCSKLISIIWITCSFFIFRNKTFPSTYSLSISTQKWKLHSMSYLKYRNSQIQNWRAPPAVHPFPGILISRFQVGRFASLLLRNMADLDFPLGLIITS